VAITVTVEAAVIRHVITMAMAITAAARAKMAEETEVMINHRTPERRTIKREEINNPPT